MLAYSQKQADFDTMSCPPFSLFETRNDENDIFLIFTQEENRLAAGMAALAILPLK